jgi:hypothetical protein
MLRENNASGEMLCNNYLETYSACLIGHGSSWPTSFPGKAQQPAHDSSHPHERPLSRRTLAPPLSRTTAQMKPLACQDITVAYPFLRGITRPPRIGGSYLPLLIGTPEELCTDGSVACATDGETQRWMFRVTLSECPRSISPV